MIELTGQILEEQLRIHHDLIGFTEAIPGVFQFAFGKDSPLCRRFMECLEKKSVDDLRMKWEGLRDSVPADFHTAYPGFRDDGNDLIEAIERLAEMENQKER